MKRLFLLLTVALFLLCGCGEKNDYTPSFQLGEGYTLSDGVISGTVIGEEYISLYSVFTTFETFVIMGESEAEPFLEKAIIPLEKGKNQLMIRFYDGEKAREYNLEIEYIPIRSLSVALLNAEKIYHVGERFDKSTVRVTALTEDGETIVLEDYLLEYGFSELGESEVGITVGDHYETVTVRVTEEYRPVLDGSYTADGVQYALRNGEAILLSAKDAEGFFAVPRTVCYQAKEYPVTELANGALAETAVTEVLIPEGVRSIGLGAFSSCEYLESVTLPETLETLGRQSFSGCISLLYTELPEGLTSISYGLFEGCTSLFRVLLPVSLTEIGERAFAGCESLTTVRAGDKLKIIGAEAFCGCDSLESLVLPRLESLGDRAFAECEALSSLALADAETIGADVFEKTDVTVYGAEKSELFAYCMVEGIPFVGVREGEPMLVTLPKAFEIGDGYPYGEVLALILRDGKMRELSDYEVSYPEDACGTLEALFTWGELTVRFNVFVSYTESVLIDTDARGAKYLLDPVNKTAVLLTLPPYVKPSKVYTPEKEGLFLVPTNLSCLDGDYTVVGAEEDFTAENCLNVTEVRFPFS